MSVIIEQLLFKHVTTVLHFMLYLDDNKRRCQNKAFLFDKKIHTIVK